MTNGINLSLRLAKVTDIELLAQLEQRHLSDELNFASPSMKGLSFGQKELAEIIALGGIVLAEAKQGNGWTIVGYVIAAPWSLFTQWPIYLHIFNQVEGREFDGDRISAENSCQYGPIWIDERMRGKGVFEQLFEKMAQILTARYRYMVTFINEDNERSFAAHTRKAQMSVLDFITFEQRDYYLLGRTCGE